eukprot:COSAG03_NODE_2748_length_2478_cov_2.254309_1_plen_181_part_10
MEHHINASKLEGKRAKISEKKKRIADLQAIQRSSQGSVRVTCERAWSEAEGRHGESAGAAVEPYTRYARARGGAQRSPRGSWPAAVDLSAHCSAPPQYLKPCRLALLMSARRDAQSAELETRHADAMGGLAAGGSTPGKAPHSSLTDVTTGGPYLDDTVGMLQQVDKRAEELARSVDAMLH